MDNSGNYITIPELLDKLYPSPYVQYKSKITLSNKTGSTFEYANSTFALAAYDIICQGEYASTVISLGTGPDTLTLGDATDFVDGLATVYRSTVDVQTLTAKTLAAMQIFDKHTGQWFNKRELIVNFEGAYTRMVHFPVPIIEVNSIKLNDETDVFDAASYIVYASRTLPDDRNNPKIKIKTYDRFLKEKLTAIDGAWGYLEPDGSTPVLVKNAIARLVMMDISTDPTQLTTSPIKSEKTDLHEIQYAVSATSIASEQNSGRTGDAEVDRIIQLYKAPLSIGGTDVAYANFCDRYNWGDYYG